MRPAAELHGEVLHFHDAHGLAVLLAENRYRALLFRFLYRQHFRDNRDAFQDFVVDKPSDFMQLLRRHGFKVRKVKAQSVRLDKGPGLMDMSAQDLLQGGVQQMRRAVGASDSGAARGVNRRRDRVADFQHTAFQYSRMQKLTALVALYVRHAEQYAVSGQFAMVRNLTAHFGVERRFVQHYRRLRARADFVLQLAFHDNR